MIKVLIVEPGKMPYTKEINGTLESMQEVVGGYIQAIYPFEDYVALVCNEEGKINDLPINRYLLNAEYGIYDCICGTFFVCSCPPDNQHFSSLSENDIKKYSELMESRIITTM